MTEGSHTEGTFIVTGADEESAVVRDVAEGRVYTLSTNPDVTEGEILEATLAAEPPLEVTWRVVDLSGRRSIPVEHSPERPTRQAREVAADQPDGEVSRIERAGEGEVHVLTVPTDRTEGAVQEILEDEVTVSRAARLGAERVEVRSGEGVVSVRYLP